MEARKGYKDDTYFKKSAWVDLIYNLIDLLKKSFCYFKKSFLYNFSIFKMRVELLFSPFLVHTLRLFH